MGQLSTLIWLFTSRCNLNCRHCYVKPRLSGLRELCLEEKLALVREAYEMGVEWIGFSGGEPLIHPDFSKVLEKCHEYGLGVSVVTNGQVVTDDMVRLLKRVDATVYVSLDGPRETHEGLRGRGTWERAVLAVRRLIEAGVRVSTVMAVSSENYSKAGSYVSLAADLGLDHAALIPIMKSGAARGSGLAPSASQYLDAIRLAEEVASERGLTLSLWCTPFAPLVARRSCVSYWSCRQADVMDVDPAGRVLLCDVLDVVITSVRRGLGTAIEEFYSSPLVRLVTEASYLREPCSSCPLRFTCLGGCFARAMLERGDLRAPDPLCPRVASFKASTV